MRVYLVDGHVAVIDRHEFHVLRIGEGMPDELSVVALLEPTAERVVAPDVCVERLIHCCDVTVTRHITAGDDLPGEVQPRRCAVAVITKVLTLHVADGHSADGRSRCLFGSRGGRVP